jgi:hypothetical protein
MSRRGTYSCLADTLSALNAASTLLCAYAADLNILRKAFQTLGSADVSFFKKY